MSEESTPTIAAIKNEIETREQELLVLRAALDLLQTEREPHVRVIASNGTIAVNHVFGSDNLTAAAAATIAAGNGKKSRNRGRENTARLLAQFDRRHVRTLNDATTRAGLSTSRQIGLGVLLRHKYLKRKGEGFLRTAKAFTK